VLPDHEIDPLNLDAVKQLFKLYYWTRGNHDTPEVLPKLAKGGLEGIQFEEAAKNCSLIDSPTCPLVIPWGQKGAALVERLRRADVLENPGLVRYPARKLQRYTVNVYPVEFAALNATGEIELVHEQFAVLSDPARYSESVGLLHHETNPDQ
jgi:hypothetical protein